MKTLLGFSLTLLSGLALLAWTPSPVEATCYTSSFVPTYQQPVSFRKGFSSHDSTVYPVAQFIGVPIPIFGSVYIGPAGVPSAAAAIGQGPPQTAAVQAPSTPVAAAAVPQPQPNSDMLAQILTAVKGIAAKQEAHGNAIRSLADRQDRHEQRMAALEAALSIAPAPQPSPPPPVAPATETPPPLPGPVPAPPPPVKQAAAPLSALAIYGRSCAACHQKGKEAAGGEFILLADLNTRAQITAGQLRSLAKHVSAHSMPPKCKGVPPTAEEWKTIKADLPSFQISE